MNKYVDADKLIAEIERYSATEYGGNTLGDDVAKGALDYVLEELIPSLQQEQPKFNVGDMVVSKKNPHLTYKILATNIPNEFSKMDYKVEIFTDGKPGLLSKSHNIHLISSDKIEDWGELIQHEQPEVDLEKELDEWRHKHFKGKRDGDYSGEYLGRESQLDIAHYFFELGLNTRKV